MTTGLSEFILSNLLVTFRALRLASITAVLCPFVSSRSKHLIQSTLMPILVMQFGAVRKESVGLVAEVFSSTCNKVAQECIMLVLT